MKPTTDYHTTWIEQVSVRTVLSLTNFLGLSLCWTALNLSDRKLLLYEPITFSLLLTVYQANSSDKSYEFFL